MILVFGQNGQLARELAHWPHVMALGRNRVDLGQGGAAAEAIKKYRPDAVINAAAFTDVDAAEDCEDLACQINGHAVDDMARTCARADIPLVHISTDYVFDGTGDQPWLPNDRPNPINAYGRSKVLGEQAVQGAKGVSVILRTSGVFSVAGKNFRTTLQKLAARQAQITVVDDQWVGPTPASALALACLKIADQLCQDPRKGGIYHFSGTPYVTWADFAQAILQAEKAKCTVTGIPSSGYPTPAARPKNARLACGDVQEVFQLTCPDWGLALRQMGQGG